MNREEKFQKLFAIEKAKVEKLKEEDPEKYKYEIIDEQIYFLNDDETALICIFEDEDETETEIEYWCDSYTQADDCEWCGKQCYRPLGERLIHDDCYEKLKESETETETEIELLERE